MLKKDLIELNRVFGILAKSGSTKFKYAVLKNADKIKSSIEILLNIEKEINEAITPYEEDRVALIRRLGKADESGNISVDLKDELVAREFQEEFQKLLDKHKEILDVYQAKVAEYQEFLSEPLTEEFKFKALSINDFPETGINTEDLELLENYKLIKE